MLWAYFIGDSYIVTIDLPSRSLFSGSHGQLGVVLEHVCDLQSFTITTNASSLCIGSNSQIESNNTTDCIVHILHILQHVSNPNMGLSFQK